MLPLPWILVFLMCTTGFFLVLFYFLTFGYFTQYSPKVVKSEIMVFFR